ncbi:glycosyltransferase family 4 protein [Bacteroides sp.]
MKNILHVLNISFVIPYFLGEQLLYMREKGYNEHIICSFSSDLNDLSNKYLFKYSGVDIYRKFSIMADIKAIIQICRYIKFWKIDIVVGHTPKAGMLAMFAAFIMRIPKRIYFRHGLLYETSSGIKKHIFILSEKIASLLSTDVVCVSPYLIEKSVTDRLSPLRKMFLLNKGSCNGVDVVGKFNPDKIDLIKLRQLKYELGISDDAWVIGYTGRLVKDKGIVELIEAYKTLASRYSNLYLLLVGPQEERDKLPNEVVEFMHSEERIIVTGLIEYDIEYYYAFMNVLVLASFREGFGTSILEASAMGVPVLTTSHTGCRDAIVNGETGLFIENDPLSIASNIEVLINDSALAKKIGSSGRLFVKDNFDQHLIWSEIEKVYLKQ